MRLVSTQAQFFGKVQLAEDVIVEAGVIVGHPRQSQIDDAIKNGDDFQTLEDLYNHASHGCVSIGKGSIIRSGTIIYSDVNIGEQLDCSHMCLIREDVNIGSRVYLKAFTHIMRDCRIGNDCRISATIADCSSVGDFSSVYGILSHRRPKLYASQDLSRDGVRVGSHCLIGRGAVCLGPMSIGDYSVVAANSTVLKDIPANSIFVNGVLKPRPRA